ncbi:hypothetical protein H8L32_23490 [Undibacterium sp. CY18W]|uniref:Uncharacterized protein n=1 Tax=Undibacterium hunanense TaxID=2762292 RepID=A0ABR6ZX44_9BURK|nr:hypothetical protein [Undibacterium hunanense]MBC3920447.1 hypothetical protein [Undibacterium hunanense]
MMMTVEQMRIQVDKTCRDEADFDETMDLLASSIAAHPEEPEFLRMRITLFDAAYDHVAALKDRQSLQVLLPDDVDNQLAILARQHRSAYWIAEDVFADRIQALSPDEEDVGTDLQDEEQDDENDDENDGAIAALQTEIDIYVDQLENQAVDGFLHLMTRHAGDASGARKILAAWSDTGIAAPWRHYTMILQALAAHPHDAALKKEKASFLVSLCEEVEEHTDKTPMGYFEHMIAGRFHALTVFEAIAAIDDVDTLQNEPLLLTQKARLQKALDDYPAAAASLRLAADAYANALQLAGEDEREDLQASLDEVLQDAAACEAGREAVYAAHFAQIESSMARLDDLPGFQPGREGPADNLAEPLANLKSSLQEWQTASSNIPAAPDEEEKLKLQSIATKIASSSMSLVQWDHIDIQAMQRTSFSEEISPWFDELSTELDKAGMQFLSWFQNLSNVAALKREAPGQCWVSAQADFALTAEAAGKIRLKRCFSVFSDGSLMLTTDSRSGTYYVSGPHVLGFSVFKSTSLTEMLTLHRARVQAHLASIPGVSVKPIRDLADIEAFENQLRTHGREFRLAQGITDREIRGMNVQFNDYFAIELKREVAALIAGLTLD